MTLQAWWLLRKLKKAQMHLDGQVGIDEEQMAAVTVAALSAPRKSVSIRGYANCLNATLRYLQDQKCIEFEDPEFIKVTYAGWHLLSATLAGTIRGVVLNVMIPVIVSVIAAIITTRLMSS